jgi:aspartyl-tRNA(Asn)/glutamyl-tRNA(Gln) amidotransferase subunit C
MQAAEVRHIAHLARLAIDEAETVDYARELSAILDLVAQMNHIDTTGIEPLANPLDQVQRLRADEVTATDQRALYQQQAPQAEQGLYWVPKVID